MVSVLSLAFSKIARDRFALWPGVLAGRLLIRRYLCGRLRSGDYRSDTALTMKSGVRRILSIVVA